MKRKILALVLAVCMALALSACSPRQVAEDLVIKLCVALGFIEGEADTDPEETNETFASAGGDVTFPETMDTTSARLVTQIEGDTMYVSFSQIANKTTSYFVAGGSSLTVTGYATTEHPNLHKFKIALWELSDDQTRTSYVQGSTIYYETGGGCSSYTITGLTAGKKYMLRVSYDSSAYYITGGLKVVGIGSDELTDLGGQNS